MVVVVKFSYRGTDYRVTRLEGQDDKYVIRAKGMLVHFEEPRNIFKMFGQDTGKWVTYVETILLKESMNEVFRKFREEQNDPQ